jgi:hypothetical protein
MPLIGILCGTCSRLRVCPDSYRPSFQIARSIAKTPGVRPALRRVASLREFNRTRWQRLPHRARRTQIRSLEALCEPAVYRREELPRLVLPILGYPQAGKAEGTSQFRRVSVQRTFSSFPSGRAGAALLVLPLVIGASARLEDSLFIDRNHAPAYVATIAAASVANRGSGPDHRIPDADCECIFCLIGAVIMVSIPPAALLPFNSRMAAFEFVVMSAVLVILGPGAISVDARLFGRREVAIRRASRPNDS